MNKTLRAILIAVVMVAAQAVARALVDRTIAVPPDWAWVGSALTAILAVARGYHPPTR